MKKIILPLLLLPCFLGTQAQTNRNALRKLQMAEFAISRLYVDTVNEDRLVEHAIIGMLEQLNLCKVVLKALVSSFR